MTQAAKLAALGSAGVATGFKNRIINGGMVIDQRNAGASVTASATNTSTYTVDRWNYYATQASKFTVQQNAGSVTPPVGFNNYLGVTITSAVTSPASGDVWCIQQVIEGYNTADLGWGSANASTVTLSFWARSSLTGTFTGAIQNGNGGLTYPFTYSISSANTWTQISVTIPGATSGTWLKTNGGGPVIIFNLGGGSSQYGTVNTWQGGYLNGATGATQIIATNGATFYITGVQLEVGTTATTFDFRSYGTELDLCYRYFWMMANTNPAPTGLAAAISSAYIETFVQYPVAMRTTPSLYSSSGTNYYNFYRANANDYFDSWSIDFATANTASIYNNTNISSTTGQAGFTHTASASAYLGFSAEL